MDRRGNYQFIQSIGVGTTCKVKLAKDIESGSLYAVKVINKSYVTNYPNGQQKLKREISIMKILHHSHILSLHEVFETSNHFYLVMEYAAKGELFDYLVAKQSIPLYEVARFFRQLIYGVEFLHSVGFCHRDLKLENLLLDYGLNIRIADFGFAKFLIDPITSTSVGSPQYVSPEIVKGDPYDGKLADIWSCGVILYALIAGCLPFDDSNIRLVFKKIRRCEYKMPDTDASAADMISRLLVADPEQRLTISQIKQHPFFSFGLPAQYLPPKVALPAKIGGPFHPGSLSNGIRELFAHIGYESEDILLSALNSEKDTKAKTVMASIRGITCAEDIPWASSEKSFISSMPEISTECLRMGRCEDKIVTSLSYENIPSIPPSEDRQTTQESLEVRVLHCKWFCVEQAMIRIEFIVRMEHMDWVYPDSFNLYCRSGVTVVCFSCACKSDASFALNIRLMCGDKGLFGTLCAEVEKGLSIML